MSETLPVGPPESSAVISPCGTYRYELNRVWDWGSDLPVVGWVMLNPSTANATIDDPTIRRCVGFTKRWGYGGLVVHNLYALRATNPGALRDHPDPVGPDNDTYLAAQRQTVFTVCAWGSHPLAIESGRLLIKELTNKGHDVWCLGTALNGSPRHPLYLRTETELRALTPYPRADKNRRSSSREVIHP